MRKLARRTPASLLFGFSILMVLPAESLANAVVRFIHAVPETGLVTVEVTRAGSTQDMGAVGFGAVTPWRSIHSGQFEWTLVAHGKSLAHGAATVGSGAYDLVLLAKSTAGVSLGIYKAEAGKPDTTLIRVIHAAPQLGSPQLRVDSKLAVSRLAFKQATPYLKLSPGMHSLSATPTNSTVPLFSAKMNLAAGKAYSEIVVGSQGQRVRVVSLVDRGAPLIRASVRRPHDGAAASDAASVTVEPGDSLWRIASDHLGPSASDEAIYREYISIWHLNAKQIGTGDPNLIFPGQRVTFPAE